MKFLSWFVIVLAIGLLVGCDSTPKKNPKPDIQPSEPTPEPIEDIHTPKGGEKYEIIVWGGDFNDEAEAELVNKALSELAQAGYFVIADHKKPTSRQHKWTLLSKHGILELSNKFQEELPNRRQLAVKVEKRDDKNIWIIPDR